MTIFDGDKTQKYFLTRWVIWLYYRVHRLIKPCSKIFF